MGARDPLRGAPVLARRSTRDPLGVEGNLVSLHLEDGRWSSLWRYQDRALEAATELLALSSISIVDRQPLFHLNVRWCIQIEDRVHDFAYFARKAIEVASAAEPEIIKLAQASKVHPDGGTVAFSESESVTLCTESVWWIIGRLIHSREIAVVELVELLIGEPWAAPHQQSSWVRPSYIRFRSDHDESNTHHCVEIQALVAAFVPSISHRIDRVLELRRENPLEPS